MKARSSHLDRERELEAEGEKILEFLARMPHGHTSATGPVVKRLMLKTDGEVILAGRLWDIKANRLFPNVYRVSLGEKES